MAISGDKGGEWQERMMEKEEEEKVKKKRTQKKLDLREQRGW